MGIGTPKRANTPERQGVGVEIELKREGRSCRGKKKQQNQIRGGKEIRQSGQPGLTTPNGPARDSTQGG